MTERINAILNIYAALVMAVLLMGCVRTKQDARKKSTRFIWLVLVCFVYLSFNSITYAILHHEATHEVPVLYHTAGCISCFSYYTLLCLVVFYVVDLVRENAVVPSRLPYSTIPVTMLGAVTWCIYRFAHNDRMRENIGDPLYWLGQAGSFYIYILLLFIIVRYRKSLGRGRIIIFSLSLALPMAAILLRNFFPGIDYLSLSLALSIIIIRNLVDIERARTVNLQEAMLREERVRLMLSQIRPHFLYNTLNTIYVLCERKPAEAQRAIEEFSEFLRANIGSLKSDRPVSFETEMKLVRHYLYLEQMRYQEELRVELFLGAQNFSLPALTIQPLVENAVKHGLAKASGGGTVRVYSFELPDEFVVAVEDDGVGFVPEEFLEAGRPSLLESGEKPLHIGLRSVRERLREMCGGSLEIQSEPGKGTAARVHLPKRERINKNYRKFSKN